MYTFRLTFCHSTFCHSTFCHCKKMYVVCTVYSSLRRGERSLDIGSNFCLSLINGTDMSSLEKQSTCQLDGKQGFASEKRQLYYFPSWVISMRNYKGIAAYHLDTHFASCELIFELVFLSQTKIQLFSYAIAIARWHKSLLVRSKACLY
jgi:hypothetical protein